MSFQIGKAMFKGAFFVSPYRNIPDDGHHPQNPALIIAPFGELQALPKGGRPVATWGPDRFARDTAWKNVAQGLEKVIARLRKTRPGQL